MALKIGGQQHWLWRAVDEHGTTLDVLLQENRDTDAAERFFRRLLVYVRALHRNGSPRDGLGGYAAATRRPPQLSGVDHREGRAAMRCNNRVEQAHQPSGSSCPEATRRLRLACIQRARAIPASPI